MEINEENKVIEEEKELENDVEHKEVIVQPFDYDTLVLGGGAVKSFIIFGALQYAIDNYFLSNINTYIGTSGGAMISFLLIIGYTPIEVMVFICTNNVIEKLQSFNMFAMMNGLGAISFLSIYEELEKLTIEKIGYIPTFTDIKEKFNKDFICCTYNITENKIEYLSYETTPTLPCLIAIRMSSNLPLIFENFKYGNSYYIDGGVANNFAIDIALEKGNKILGIHNKMQGASITKDTEFNMLNYMFNILFIPIGEMYKMKIANLPEDKVDIVQLEEKDIHVFNFNISTNDKLNMFSKGYQQMKEYFEK